MKIGERIKFLRVRKNVTQTELADIIGTTKQNIYKYENGIITNIPSDKIEAISRYFAVSPSYLMGWDDEITNKEDNSGITMLDTGKISIIPLFESVSAGFGAYADSCSIGCVPVYVENNYDAENMLAIIVKGDSMYPKIEDGDTVVVRKQNDFDNGDIVVVLIDGDEGLVKRIYYNDNKLVLESINPEYKNKEFIGREIERITVVGVVKKIIKDI